MNEKTLNFLKWQNVKQLPELLTVRLPDEEQQLARIRYVERNIGFLVKAAVIIVLFYYLFFSHWMDAVNSRKHLVDTLPHEIILERIRLFFVVYVILNGGFAAILMGMRHFTLKWIQHFVAAMSAIDAVFLAALTLVTGGFDSILFWAFLGMIIRNAAIIPLAWRQLGLNFFVTACYVIAGLADIFLGNWEQNLMDETVRLALQSGETGAEAAEPFFLRLILLILMTVVCYGVQVLLEKQRLVVEEAREHAVRQEQLQATGRLAAEIAHQLKNPLGIINNAAFTLQRTVREGKTITQQIKIIREEVERSDRIITELMGYARLSEGQVEKLCITQELDSAVDQVFPPGSTYNVKVIRDYAPALPTIIAQRGHLSEVFVNLLQNAREAMNGEGVVKLTARYGENYSVVVTVEDNGPGIPTEKANKIFEPYFTTKEKGTGLGLAIVKHNTELYNGTVHVESEVGKGTRFTVVLPAKALINIKK
ncbi:MAG: sensor histidine kinase [Verrucomicrobiales bacterium]